jgi:hypothetical protein
MVNLVACAAVFPVLGDNDIPQLVEELPKLVETTMDVADNIERSRVISSISPKALALDFGLDYLLG